MANSVNNFEVNWFKGSRKYIQAADLVNAAWKQAGDVSCFDFSSRKVAEYPVCWVAAGNTVKENILATFQAKTLAGKSIDWVAVQDTTRSIDRMDDFPEEEMFAACAIQNQQVVCPILPAFTTWEHISSLHKYLLGKIFDHPSWWFVRIEGNEKFHLPAKNISIRYMEKKRILYRSEILINGENAGVVDYAMR